MNPKTSYFFLGALTVAFWWGASCDILICVMFAIFFSIASVFALSLETINMWDKD